ncbi:MAG: hypothetical protein OXF94_09390 [Gammaproteobacteria bacterium]|nr:hypothetical protein [Gammaproteobacteria bacterium]
MAGIVGAAVLAAFVGDRPGSAEETYERLYGRFYEHDNPYAEVIARSEANFDSADVESSIPNLDDDFTLYEITDQGAEEVVRGVEQVRAAFSGLLGSGTRVGANVYKWGLTDNTLVQIEEDFYRTEDGGTRAVKSLVVVEHRDGKRWREWRFKPQDR